jgi:hypothetical protein
MDKIIVEFNTEGDSNKEESEMIINSNSTIDQSFKGIIII